MSPASPGASRRASGGVRREEEAGSAVPGGAAGGTSNSPLRRAARLQLRGAQGGREAPPACACPRPAGGLRRGREGAGG